MKLKTIAVAALFPLFVSVEGYAKRGECKGEKADQSFNSEKVEKRRGGGHGGFDADSILGSYPVFELTATQEENLKFMWEEEKLARDVYLHFLAMYGSKVFKNISKAEQKHLNALGAILEKYSIPEPSEESNHGIFQSQELQELYNNLIAKGELSEKNAFEVGKTIEVVDIDDLKTSIETAHPDAKAIYEKLLEGSYRHLAAFERWMAR